MPKVTINPKRDSVWRDPRPDEATAYFVEDSADIPPALTTIAVVAVGYEDTRIVLNGQPTRFPNLGRGRRMGVATRGRMVTAYDLIDFTPATAWSRYIESQESHIEDLKREMETRERYRVIALAEHVKVGPSGPPAEPGRSNAVHRHKWTKSADGDRRTCGCGEDQPRCRVCGGNRDTCGHFVGAGAL